jgi:hypothetical protein
MRHISTFDELMQFYGDQHPNGGAQYRFMCSRTCLANWKARGIPAAWHARIMLDLIAAGKTFDPGLFDAADHPGYRMLIDSITPKECGGSTT